MKSTNSFLNLSNFTLNKEKTTYKVDSSNRYEASIVTPDTDLFFVTTSYHMAKPNKLNRQHSKIPLAKNPTETIVFEFCA